VVLVAAFALWRNVRAPHWRELRPGIEFTTLAGEPYCRLGSSSVAVLRVDPKHARLRARYYARQNPPRLLTVLEWQKSTGALAVFNAGQFYPDFRYMGLLVCGGDTVSSKLHAEFQAALVADSGRRTCWTSRACRLARASAGATSRSRSLLFRPRGRRARARAASGSRTARWWARTSAGWIVCLRDEGGLQRWPTSPRSCSARRSRLTHAMSKDGGLEDRTWSWRDRGLPLRQLRRLARGAASPRRPRRGARCPP